VDRPSNGSLTLNPDGSFDYTPDDGFNGDDTFTYEASDPENNTDQAEVTIQVLNTTLSIGTVEGALVNQSVQVPLNAQDLIDVGAVTLKIEFGSSVLSFEAINDKSELGLEAGVEDGVLTVEGFDTEGVDLEGEIATLEFTFLGGAANLSFLEESEVTDTEANPIETGFSGGSVAGETPVISVSDQFAPGGETTSVPLEGEKIRDVGSLSLRIEYDASVLTFERTENVLDGFGEFSVGTPEPGILQIEGFSTSGVDPADGDGAFADLVFAVDESFEPGEETFLSFVASESEVTNPETLVYNVSFNEGRLFADQREIAVDPTDTIDFGEVQQCDSETETITITNEAVQLDLSGSVELEDEDGPFSIQEGGGDFTIEAGESQEVVVEFAPAVSAGEYENAVLITHNAENRDSPVRVGLIGETVSLPLVVNEVLYSVPTDRGSLGDANEDGTVDAEEDQFVEIYNTSSDPIDVSGFEVETSEGPQHVVADGTELSGETALTVFGGGTPASSIPGRVQTASTGGLSLSSGGDEVALANAECGAPVAQISYEGSADGESITRDPDFTGSFVPHTSADPNRLFSPGKTNDGEALPVELVRFEGRADGQSVLLSWKTAQETRNAGFGIEHQVPETETWEKVAFVESKAENGTSRTAQSYEHVVGDLAAGTHRFRLRQVDLDGGESRGDPIAVKVRPEAPAELTAPGPNPTAGTATFRVVTRKQSEATVVLYNSLGQEVRTVYEGQLPSGESRRLEVSAAGLPSGVYFLRLKAGPHVKTRRLTVVE
jgi:hypothetical protein